MRGASGQGKEVKLLGAPSGPNGRCNLEWRHGLDRPMELTSNRAMGTLKVMVSSPVGIYHSTVCASVACVCVCVCRRVRACMHACMHEFSGSQVSTNECNGEIHCIYFVYTSMLMGYTCG